MIPGTRPSRLVLVLVALTLVLALSPPPARATTVVPVSDVELVQNASAIVVARVLSIDSHWDRTARQVFTDVRIAVDEVLLGNVAARSVTVRVTGGRVGGLDVWVEGNPEFRRGETVLLFLQVGRDGRLRVAHLYQGKFSVVVNALTGEELALRAVAPDVRVLSRPGTSSADAIRDDIRRVDDIRRLVRAFRDVTRPPVPTSASATSGTVAQSSGAFTFLGDPSRWFEPDSGQPVTMLLDENGEPAAPTRGFGQMRDGYAEWNSVAGSTFRFRDGGFTSARGQAFDGVNAITFGDPQGLIGAPSGCSGTLATTVFYRSTSETRMVNGQRFYRIFESDVVFADGWRGCGFYETYANFAEVATHELGHVLGLGHSTNSGATMYAFAHFDGRGASLTADDRAGVVFAYPAPATLNVTRSGPGNGTVTSNPAGINCGSDCTQPYASGTSVTLTATPAAGSVFGGWSGGGCSGTGSCTTIVSGSSTITATFNVTGLGVTFTSPASGATVRGSTTVTLSATGGSGFTYRVAVDGVTAYTGGAPSFTWDTRPVGDGAHTLTGVVTDSLGRTASTSRTVTVANTSSPGSFTASFSAPAEGATVRTTLSIGMATSAPWGQSKTFTLTVDGTVILSQTTTGTTLWYNFDTRTIANGSRTLRLTVAYNGATATATRTINVANTSGTTTGSPPLTASFTSPGAGATVSGMTTIGMAAGGTSGPVTFTLTIDGTVVDRETVSGTTASYSWDTRAVSNGSRILSLSVTDGAGRTATATRTVMVSNTNTSTNATFTASFSWPNEGATVRTTLSIGMATSAPWGQPKTFTLTIDGNVILTRSMTGTTLWYNLDSRTIANGPHTLRLTVTYNGATATATRRVNVAN
jgi:hypothetical protein